MLIRQNADCEIVTYKEMFLFFHPLYKSRSKNVGIRYVNMRNKIVEFIRRSMHAYCIPDYASIFMRLCVCLWFSQLCQYVWYGMTFKGA